jgi:hypothetical protein
MTTHIQRHTALPDLEPGQVIAVQWTGHNIDDIRALLPDVNARYGDLTGRLIVSTDSSGDIWVRGGWYIARTANGWRFVMHPEHFTEQYRPVSP